MLAISIVAPSLPPPPPPLASSATKQTKRQTKLTDFHVVKDPRKRIEQIINAAQEAISNEARRQGYTQHVLKSMEIQFDHEDYFIETESQHISRRIS